MKKFIYTEIVPTIIVIVVIYIYIYPHVTAIFDIDVWDKINPNNVEYSIHPSYYMYIVSSFMLLGFTVIQTFFDKTHLSIKILIVALLILVTLPLYVTQSVFIVKDTESEQLQNNFMNNNKKDISHLNEKFNKLESKLIYQESIIIELKKELDKKLKD